MACGLSLFILGPVFGQDPNSKSSSGTTNAPYKGRVLIESQTRLLRPQSTGNAAQVQGQPKTAAAQSGSRLGATLGRDEFSLGAKSPAVNLLGGAKFGSDFIKTEGAKSSLFEQSPRLEGRSESNTPAKPDAKIESVPAAGSGGVAPDEDYYPQSGKYRSKKILIRLKRYRSLSEMEVVWEAARAACRWLKKGADVTILLDMDAIHAADRNDTGLANYEPNRGNGNSSAEKLTTPQDQLNQFVQSGGKLIASERWVKLAGISHGSLITGTKLVKEEDMDDLLLDSSFSSVISY